MRSSTNHSQVGPDLRDHQRAAGHESEAEQESDGRADPVGGHRRLRRQRVFSRVAGVAAARIEPSCGRGIARGLKRGGTPDLDCYGFGAVAEHGRFPPVFTLMVNP